MIKLKESLQRDGTPIILVFSGISRDVWPIPEQSWALKTRRRGGGTAAEFVRPPHYAFRSSLGVYHVLALLHFSLFSFFT